MKTFEGDLVIEKGDKTDYSKLERVSGSVYVQEGATFTAPALTEVSGSVDVRQGATFTAPALTEVSGYVDVRQGATFTAPALTEVSGYVDVRQGATFTAPKLAWTYKMIGYPISNHEEKFPAGRYMLLTANEVGYLKQIKPLIAGKRLNMAHWHEDSNWKNQATEYVTSNECKTTHCLAGWIQIFEKDKYNDIEAEDCGKKCAPNLASLFHSEEHEVESVVNTLLPDSKVTA